MTIRTSTRNGVRIITVGNPERRNALTPGDLSQLESAIANPDASTGSKSDNPVVYLQGDGEAFCAGADLDSVASLSDPAAFARHGQRVARTIEETDAVVVAGIDGPARGGGVELALACDIRVGTPDATFAETGIRLGLFGAWGGTVRLPRIVGEGNALDLALTGRTIDAEEARQMGLVSQIVSNPFDVASDLTTAPEDALWSIKSRIRDRRDATRQEQAEAEVFERLHEHHADSLESFRNS